MTPSILEKRVDFFFFMDIEQLRVSNYDNKKSTYFNNARENNNLQSKK
jgi:hypothetical protein